MAFRAGRYSEITISGVNLSSYLDSIDFSDDVELLETTAFTNTSKTFVMGLHDGKVDLKGKYDPTTSTGATAVLTNALGNNSIGVNFFPGGNSAGQIKRYFNAYVVSYKESSSVGDIVGFESALQIDGPILASGI